MKYFFKNVNNQDLFCYYEVKRTNKKDIFRIVLIMM